MLDGVRVVEDSTEKSDFIIVARRAGCDHVISDSATPLHDLYQEKVWDQVFGDGPQP